MSRELKTAHFLSACFVPPTGRPSDGVLPPNAIPLRPSHCPACHLSSAVTVPGLSSLLYCHTVPTVISSVVRLSGLSHLSYCHACHLFYCHTVRTVISLTVKLPGLSSLSYCHTLSRLLPLSHCHTVRTVISLLCHTHSPDCPLSGSERLDLCRRRLEAAGIINQLRSRRKQIFLSSADCFTHEPTHRARQSSLEWQTLRCRYKADGLPKNENKRPGEPGTHVHQKLIEPSALAAFKRAESRTSSLKRGQSVTSAIQLFTRVDTLGSFHRRGSKLAGQNAIAR